MLSMVAPITVLLVDDQAIMLDGLEALLSRDPGLSVVGRAGNGKEAVASVAALDPDVVLMDISMPEMDGIEATRRIKKLSGTSRVLVLSMYNNKEFVRELMAAGASGYLLKNAGHEELHQAIRSVAEGRTYLAAEVRKALEEGNVQLRHSVAHGYQALTKREKEIISLIANGRSSQEIAEQLFLSIDTVNTHRKNILHKLDLTNTASLVKYSVERGLA